MGWACFDVKLLMLFPPKSYGYQKNENTHAPFYKRKLLSMHNIVLKYIAKLFSMVHFIRNISLRLARAFPIKLRKKDLEEIQRVQSLYNIEVKKENLNYLCIGFKDVRKGLMPIQYKPI